MLSKKDDVDTLLQIYEEDIFGIMHPCKNFCNNHDQKVIYYSWKKFCKKLQLHFFDGENIN